MLPARLRVLLIEDDPVTVRIISATLQRVPSPRFDVVQESSLTEALRRLTAGEHYDIAILDLNLPDSLGIQTLAKVQARAPDLPILVMTGDADPTMAELALEVGAQDYLVKGETAERTITRSIRYAISRKTADLERQAISDRLNSSLAAENKRLDEENALARDMQFGLLPSRERLAQYRQSRALAVDYFFEPSAEIGGDLWGCVEAGPLRTIIYTFDFSGHGVGAALNVFRLHALLSQLGDQIIDPAATLGRLNVMLAGMLPRGQYATVFLGVIDTGAATLTWSAGGAPPPLLFDGEGGYRLLDTKGKPLGISATARYSNRVTAFPELSSLFLYSDAIPESRVAGGKMLGEDRLISMVKRFHSADGIDIAKLVERLFDTVKLPLEDDLTAVSIGHLAVPVAAHTQQAQASAPLLLTSRRLELVETGLAPPYSGFIEIGANGVSDVGAACLDAVEQGGLCLSLTVAGAWACCASALLQSAVTKRLGGDRDWEAVELCLSEAITNAIVHGGLGVESVLRETPEGLADYGQRVHERLNDPVYARKRIEVTVIPLPGGALQITVYDRGDGFDLKAALARSPAPGAKHGRGLMLINKVARSVASMDGGRTLIVTI
jgi:sigma-B regulation protein RsbU (phosphoserine phosphatase)